eukprot:336620-Hanusia_phi.AAC.3
MSRQKLFAECTRSQDGSRKRGEQQEQRPKKHDDTSSDSDHVHGRKTKREKSSIRKRRGEQQSLFSTVTESLCFLFESIGMVELQALRQDSALPPPSSSSSSVILGKNSPHSVSHLASSNCHSAPFRLLPSPPPAVHTNSTPSRYPPLAGAALPPSLLAPASAPHPPSASRPLGRGGRD